MNQPITETFDPTDYGLEADEFEQLVEWRRHLHANPELSNEEHQTAEFIRQKLAEFGIDDVETVVDTGVVAVVEGSEPGPTLGWRADIDALPIQEATGASYASKNQGVMHACGHDVHTTVGLGLANRVAERSDELAGRVKFIFQPAEEATPEDEPVGAEKMAQAGALEDPDVDAIFALHCMPKLDAGHIGFPGGDVWAGSDLVEIDIQGTKAHGAMPHEGVDAGLVASQIVVALQSVVSRRIDARDSCVLTIGEIEAGSSYNILPQGAKLTGILRSLSLETTEQAKEEIRRLVDQTARGFGASAEVTFTPGARPVSNDIELERLTREVLDEQTDGVAVEHPPQLAAEDFAAFANRVPGCYMFLGIRNTANGITNGLHTPEFDVDERCLAVGVGAMSDTLFKVAESLSG
jgi:amidohydrolase